MKISLRTALTAALAAALACTGLTIPPTAAAARSAAIVSTHKYTSQVADIVVHSPSMNRDIPLTVLSPKNKAKPAGVLYLLNGAGGGEDAANWLNKSDVVKFFARKNVYVVIPMKGAFSYYTDWIKPDPVLGVNKWSTFLGNELPGVIDRAYSTNGKNAIAGISSSATSVLNLAISHKGLYKAVSAYSGCASTSSDMGKLYIRLVTESRGGADVTNMWGPLKGSGWVKNDPIVHAAGLRGVSLYLSSATGLPGKYDTARYVPQPATLADQIVLGGGIEAATRVCTEDLAAKLRSLRIPATVDRPVTGTHSWKYWQDQLHKSWPQMARKIGA